MAFGCPHARFAARSRVNMFRALGHVSMYEVEHGRLMLSALVMKQDSGTAGPGFADLARHLKFDVQDEEAFWKRELEEVVRFWSAKDLVLLLDAAVDRVMEELKQIKAQLRKLGATGPIPIPTEGAAKGWEPGPACGH